ncbi:methionyl-tRNA formyltransferase [Psychrobacillus sp. NPDC058041]|uniref:methionyl-tRNA formyltransferase n=1 Tax=Psychrobacillus sp. NPDC058041 TaxID=3346310 RepID=UPI0036D7B1C8
MKIIFIGCVQSSEYFLKAVYRNTEAKIAGIVTKTQSNFNADHVSLEKFAIKHGIDWLDYKDNNTLLSWIHEKSPDVIYCFGWSHLLPREVYSIAKKGAVGYHPALLPQNRGRHPIIWALALGLKETGSTFFYLSDRADSGDILNQKVVSISESDDAGKLYQKLLKIGEKQVIQLTDDLINNRIIPIPQVERKANYWRKRSKKDGEIDWRMGSQNILQLVKALTKPYVGAHFVYQDHEYKVWSAKEVLLDDWNYKNIEPGKILAVSSDSFIVKTGDGLIEITECELKDIPKIGDYI